MRARGVTAGTYTPKARSPFGDKSLFWQTLRKERTAFTSEWLELDLYEHSKLAVEELVTEGNDTALNSLYHTLPISGKLSRPLCFSFH